MTGLQLRSLSSTHPSSQEMLEKVLSLSIAIFSTDPNSKYASMGLWQDHLSHPSSIILYLSPEYTPDDPVAFLFAYPRRHVTSLRGGQKESLHIWIAGVLPKRRKEGCLARLVNELDSNAFLTTCTNPTQFPDMWRWLTRRGWVVDQELGGGKVMLSKRASE